MDERREQTCCHCGRLITAKTTYVSGAATQVWIHTGWVANLSSSRECPGAEP